MISVSRLLRHTLLVMLFALTTAPFAETMAQSRKRMPLYIVNGERMSEEEVREIDPKDIEDNHLLPADEQTIGKYGHEAANGVVVITLRYDTPARFETEGYSNFTTYLQHTVKWDKNMPAERVSLRLTIDSEGRATIAKVLQSTSRQYQKRVERAIALSPYWTPATKNGKAVESTQLVNLLMPEGKQLPAERGVIII